MFYERFTRLCKEHGGQPTPLLCRLKMSPGNLSKWKNGGSVSYRVLITLCNYFEFSMSYFFIYELKNYFRSLLRRKVPKKISFPQIVTESAGKPKKVITVVSVHEIGN